MQSLTPIRIIIADDHEIFRDGFRVMLKKYKGIELVGEAANGQELLTLTADLIPDVVVTDIKMPVMDGIAACRRLQRQFPAIGVIALSMFDEEGLVVEMMECGAKGYLLKNASKEEIIEAIETAYKGDTYFSNLTSRRLMNMLAASQTNPFRKRFNGELTSTEKRIIEMICEEKLSKEIADELRFSVRTVESYRSNIQEKIGVKNVVGLVIYAIKNNLYRL